ncbi:uridine diphosphate glucose pyrophosphatase NUDT14 isoform X2 [Stegostoma tigrinum]|uniref:uridine diphosphate glucose pyrophosphatase NUDT14 isoform X2 n=1 Tax=Stegostoma tigrinum TaxID=3053191 RepID=UPI00286FF0CE|nr:uridine diphosphate glucose pyrophosphatase NUDT14 isoform X2 [Stegostoma tigrinum]
MDEVEDVEIGPCLNSRYLRLQRVHFTQNGARKYWDFMKTHDSVSILIFNTTRECFILVKQFRPAVYMCECARQGMLPDDETTADDSSQLGKLLPASAGITYELCSGIVDKPGLSLQQIAKEEVLEECGYDVPVESLQKITSYSFFGLSLKCFSTLLAVALKSSLCCCQTSLDATGVITLTSSPDRRI